MTTVTVSGTVSGYNLKSPITVLSITGSGYIDSTGVVGGTSGAYTVANYGRVNGEFSGVHLQDGGSITNGSDTNETAVAKASDDGVFIEDAAGEVSNYGTILSSANLSDFPSFGVYVPDGGTVTNGSPVDSAARIEGKVGVGRADTLTNFGTIQGFLEGVSDVGAITNGAASEPGALIEGASSGVYASSSLTITNFGTVEGVFGSGIEAESGGVITNGGPGDGAALIEGYSGVSAKASATVGNFGTIRGAGTAAHDAGVYLGQGGSVANGGAGGKTALIEGYDGIEAKGAGAAVTNLGTILGVGDSDGDAGVYLDQGGSVTNGAAADHSALILGYAGVFVSNASARVVNFGAIEATNSAGPGGAGSYDAVSLGAGGSMTNGAVNDTTALLSGYAGLFFLGSGASTNFGIIQATGGTFGNGVTLGGGADLTNGAANDRSALVEGYTGAWLLDGDTLTNFGTIEGVGGEAVTFTNPGELVVEAGSSFIGAVDGGGSILDLASGGETVTGALSGSGVTISGGIRTSAFNDFATLDVGSAATVTLSGKIAVPSLVVASGKLLVANGTTLTGAGGIEFTDSASNEITGTSATSLLTNDARIEGEGQVGDGAMELTNAAAGLIISLGAGSLTLNTGTSTIQNAGEIASEGTGGLTISSPLDNTNVLVAYSSPLTVEDAVTGSGRADVESTGTLILKGAFNQNVTFAAGATGALELGDSKVYTTGSITGFSKTGANSLDLLDIPFVSGTTTATYSGTTTSGVLTVKDGTNVATIHLTGNYTTSHFTVSSSSAGGTKVVDPATASTSPHGAAPLSPHPFIAAMAGFGAPEAGAAALEGALWRTPPPMLAMPRAAQIA
jgi:hypothetical protein